MIVLNWPGIQAKQQPMIRGERVTIMALTALMRSMKTVLQCRIRILNELGGVKLHSESQLLRILVAQNKRPSQYMDIYIVPNFTPNEVGCPQ